jgi:hypothetical protein
LTPPQPNEPAPLLGGLMRNVMSAFAAFSGKPEQGREQLALVRQSPAPSNAPAELSVETPLPPPRPADLGPPAAAPPPDVAEAPPSAVPVEPAAPPQNLEASKASVRISEASPPLARPVALTYSYGRQQTPYRLPEIITGSQPILPTGFGAYADLRR